MNRLRSECLNNSDFQFDIVDEMVTKISARLCGVRYDKVFVKGGNSKQRASKQLYCDLMINVLGYPQTKIAKKKFQGVDSLINSMFKTININNGEVYQDRKRKAISILEQVKANQSRDHLDPGINYIVAGNQE